MVGKTLLTAMAVIISAVFVVGSWITTGTPNIEFLRFFSLAVFFCSLLLILWDQWAWKLRPFQLLPGVPRDVSGTWEATLDSLWIDPETKKSPDPKTVYIVIRQTSSNASVILISNESKSKSSIARVIKEDGSWLIHYVYTNEPQVDLRAKSPIHHGSGVLSIVGHPAQRVAGSYWTDRDSKGKLTLERRSTEYAEDFKGGTDIFTYVKGQKDSR
ncbi:hypothetical protein EV141_0728 [Microcella putealis]|uniref:CD-NTase-associated protein 15 domain-containing protein n=1 Tax=Microcella putealis TaxID=337005 RepID=A0A4Q7LXT0_9MICO|nr:hypothetical protein [Microcella putealis]RZS59501.1 hypothetical protein EV141_0728 [Microcella putealis]TQM26614.1 hypothetical protein BJ957_0024 [Microcella putealis]